MFWTHLNTFDIDAWTHKLLVQQDCSAVTAGDGVSILHLIPLRAAILCWKVEGVQQNMPECVRLHMHG